MNFRYVILTGPMLIALAFAGNLIGGTRQPKSKLDPAEVETISRSDYIWKKDIHVARGEKEEAIATCLELVEVTSEVDSEVCQRSVYREFDDIDNRIRLYEKKYQRERENGDSTESTEHTLKELRAERDKRK